MMKKSRIAILGAGFSGLTLARELHKLGFDVEIFESQNRVGGLIQTKQSPILAESAAHAILADQNVENLFRELNLSVLTAQPESKAKWIFRASPRRWPLSLSQSFRIAFCLLKSLLKKQIRPRAGESVAQWAQRNASPELADYVLGPGLQGIYAAMPEKLSASLILGGLPKVPRAPKGGLRGSVAPLGGMQMLMEACHQDLYHRQVPVHLSSQVSLGDLKSRFEAIVLATSLPDAAEILKSEAPVLSQKLKTVPMVSISSATLGFTKDLRPFRGFGCLFPARENFKSLGVLFNTDIFKGRGPLSSETWILPGFENPQSESDILDVIQKDRRRLGLGEQIPQSQAIFSWARGLPMYGAELEKLLFGDDFQGMAFVRGARIQEVKFPLYLTGNYLGGIGLGKILGYNQRLSQRIQKELA